MLRLLAILVGVAVLIGGGVVHGLWTDRWRPPEELARAVERLARLPEDIDDWKGEEYKQEAETLAIAGAAAHYSRNFTDPVSGEKVLVILQVGKPARMSVHRPEHCYRAAGYELSGKPLDLKLTPQGQPTTPLWTGLFVRDDPAAGSTQMRLFWTWYAGGRWEAPDDARWAFARRRVLYKLYVIRSVAGPAPLAADPCVRLLGQLLPVLNRTLAGE